MFKGWDFRLHSAAKTACSPDGRDMPKDTCARSASSRIAESDYKTILDQAGEILLISDNEGNLIEVNAAAANQTGYSRTELLAMNLYDIDTNRSLQKDRQNIWPLLTDKESLLLQRTLRRKDGSEFLAEIRLSQASITGETCIVALANDVTERVHNRHKLEENEHRLATLMANFPGMVYRCRNTPEWPMLFVSRGTETLTGYTPETFVGPHARPYNDIVHPDDRAKVWNETQNACSQNRSFICEYRIRTADGTQKWVWEQGAAISSDQEDTILEGFVIDVTEYKELEDKALELADMEQKVRDYQKEDSIRRIMGAVAHHFNNKMHIILGCLDLTDVSKQKFDIVKLRRTLDQARTYTEDAAALSRRMLDCLGQSPLKRMPVAIDAICQDAVDQVEQEAPPHISFIYRAEAGIYETVADGNAIQTALQNLLQNATEALGTSAVQISLSNRPCNRTEAAICFPEGWKPDDMPYAWIHIQDDGEGISPTMTHQIFDPFFSTRFPGRGIGLTGALELIRSHGGSICVKSTEGVGSTFCVAIPLQPPTPEHAQPTLEPPTVAQPGSQPDTVLIVDDETPLLDVASMQLKKLGYRACKATHAKRAREIFAKQHDAIAAILIDVRMPGESGWDLVQSLQSTYDQLPPFIMMSANQTCFTPPSPHLPQPIGFLKKPYLMSDLAALLRKCQAAE